MRADELTDEQWRLIEKYFPGPRLDRPGRKPSDARRVMNGILWILRTGEPWSALPDRFPPFQTCHRHFKSWLQSGVLVRVLDSLARHLRRSSLAKPNEATEGPAAAGARRSATARPERSWQRQTSLALRSPYSALLRSRTRSPATVTGGKTARSR
jgi:transposase